MMRNLRPALLASAAAFVVGSGLALGQPASAAAPEPALRANSPEGAAPPSKSGEAPAAANVRLDEAQLREATSIFDDTWSPFCPGRTLSSCTSGKAAEWREDVRKWLAEGLSREEVMARLQARVPGFTLDTIPDSEGVRYGPWVLGGLFVAALGVLGAYHARRGSLRPSETETTKEKEGSSVDRKALAAELEALED